MKFQRISQTGSVIPIPETYRDAIELLRSDYYRCYGRRLSFWRMYLLTFVEPTFKFLFWHRLSQVDVWGIIRVIAKWRHRHYMFKYGLMIPASTKIGYGFYIGHPNGIIINHTAVIGNNVNLSQFTTIGSNEGHAALIGDNVYIGPACSVVEDVVIGHDVTIGAGSVVTHSISECSVAVGNPARVIDSHLPCGKYVGNRWPLNKD